MLPLSSVLFCVSGIVAGNETGTPSDVFGACLSLFGTIVFSLNCYPRIPLTKVLFWVITEFLVFCSNVHENMVLHATPYTSSRDTDTSCVFYMKVII